MTSEILGELDNEINWNCKHEAVLYHGKLSHADETK
jgi:hypothetical protein